MFDVQNFDLREMTECGKVLREIGETSKTMEEVANRITRFFFDEFAIVNSGEKNFALVRFFKTHTYSTLEADLKDFVSKNWKNITLKEEMKCLVLLATSGELAAWNSRKLSEGHQAIPLPKQGFVEQLPMVAGLIRQLGVKISSLVTIDEELILDSKEKGFGVFYIPDAVGSKFIPDQENFVIPHGVKSVLGFGGMMPSGNIYAVILFSKRFISVDTANLFKPLALAITFSILPFDQNVFDQR